jgi:hypothetical protein
MNQRIINQLNMVGTIIDLTVSDPYKAVWTGQSPAAFATDFATLQANYAATTQKAALAAGAIGGASDAKTAAETNLEDTTYTLTRALANYLKKAGDLVNYGKTDLAKRDLVRLTGQELLAKTTEIRDLANTVVALPDAIARGVTAARITAVTTGISAYQSVMNSPRGQIINRSTLIKEVETSTAGLLDEVSDLDDLVLQFDGTDAGLQFIAAWKHARNIVDAGHGPGADPAPPAAPPTA